MADNQILISAKFDLAGLDKQMKTFATRFRSALNKSLENLKIDLTKLEGLKDLKVSLKIDFAGARKQIKEFRDELLNKPLEIATKATAAQPQGVNQGSPALIIGSIDEKAINEAKVALESLRGTLRSKKFVDKEVTQSTAEYATELKRLTKILDDVKLKEQAFNRAQEQHIRNGTRTPQAGAAGPTFLPLGESWTPSDKDLERLNIAGLRVENLTKKLKNANVQEIQTQVETKRLTHFMESFGFKVGIVGFGLTILGGTLQSASQALQQFYFEAAKAIEPLERVRNLLEQDPEQSGGQGSFILSELRRLADYPGANLEQVAKTFRSLQTIGLQTVDTLKLLEGLTKATARSGLGAEGLNNIAAQLRDFASSDKLSNMEVRSIITSGGKDIANIFQEQFGGANAASINQVAPKEFFAALVAGLDKLPAPLETTTDKINKLVNSLNGIKLVILDIVKPAMDSLINLLHKVEEAVTKLGQKFKLLSPDQQVGIGQLIIGISLATAALGALLIALGPLYLSVATGWQLFEQFGNALLVLRFRLGIVGKEVSLVGTLATKITEPIKVLVGVIYTFIKSLTQIFALFRASGIGKVASFFKTFTAATEIVKTAASLTKVVGVALKLFSTVNILLLAFDLLLGYFTNAGGAADILNGAFRRLWTVIKNLGDRIYKFFQTDIGKRIITVILSISNLLTGVLADAVAVIINAFTRLLEVVEAVFEVIENPNLANLDKLGNAFFLALVGPIVDLGVLLAASFVQAVGEATSDSTKSVFGTTERTMFLGLSEETPIADALGNLVGGSFQKIADSMRESIFAKYEEIVKDTGKVTEQTAQDVSKALTVAQAAALSFSKTFRELADSVRASMNKMLDANTKFLADLANQRQEKEFSRLLSTDVGQAQERLREFARASGDRDRNVVLDSFGRGVREQARLQAGQPALRPLSLESSSPIENNRIKKIEELRGLYNSIIALSSTGTKDIQRLEGLINQAMQLQFNINKLINSPESKALKLDPDIDKSITDRVGEIGERLKPLQELINKANEEAQQAQQNEIKFLEGKTEEIRLRYLALEASQQEGKLAAERATLEKERVRLQEQVTRAGELGLEDIEALTIKLHKVEKQILEKDKEIAEVRNYIGDQLIEQNDRIAQQAAKTQQQLELDKLRLQYAKELAKTQRQAFQEGVDALKTMIQQQEELNSKALGAGATGDSINARISLQGRQRQFSNLEIKTQLTKLVKSVSETIDGSAILAQLVGIHPKEFFARLLENFSNTDTTRFEVGLSKILATATKKSLELSAKDVELQEKLADLVSTGSDTTKVDEEIADLAKTQDAVGKFLQFINTLYRNRLKILDDQHQLQLQQLDGLKRELQVQRDLLDLQKELQDEEAKGAVVNPRGGVAETLKRVSRDREKAHLTELKLIKQKAEARRLDLKTQHAQNVADLRAAAVTQKQIDALPAKIEALKLELDLQLGIVDAIEETATANENAAHARQSEGLFGAASKLNEAFERLYGNIAASRQELQRFFDTAASGENIINALQAWIEGTGSAMQVAGQFALTMAANLGRTISAFLQGDEAAKSFAGAIGDVLIAVGEYLIQMAIAIPIMAFANALAHGATIWEALIEAAIALPGAIITGVIGAALVVAGSAMGGGKNARSTSQSNSLGSADANTGAQRDSFNPDTDPRTVYQKALMAQIQIDIRTDDSQIVKTVIKHVNQNGRLATLIGNRQLQFGY